jgi:pentatricopeptide repeat protein
LGLCVAYEEWESVLEVLDIMKRQGLKQEKSSYRACLQACFEAGNGGSAKEILTAMDKALVQVQPSDIALTVVAMCRNSIVVGKDAGSSWWRKALGLLKSSAAGTASSNSDIPMVVSKDNVIPVQAYDAVLQCMVEDRQWKDAVRLLRLMEEGSSSTSSPARKKQQQQQQQQQEPKTIGFHPAPEVSTYRAVIECCVSTNQGAEQAVQVLYNMKDRGVKVSKANSSNRLVMRAFWSPCLEYLKKSSLLIRLQLHYNIHSQLHMFANLSFRLCPEKCNGDELCSSWN